MPSPMTVMTTSPIEAMISAMSDTTWIQRLKKGKKVMKKKVKPTTAMPARMAMTCRKDSGRR